MAPTKSLPYTIPLSIYLTTGCAPLQQAPLVYSSKVTVGIDVAGTTTEQPGVSINVGYKQVDAAYVPVAVAKQCDENESGRKTICTDKTYQIKEIKGNNKAGDSEVPKSALDAAQKRINDFKAISQKRDTAENELAKAKNKFEDAKKQLNTFESEKKESLTAATSKKGIGLSPEENELLLERSKLNSQLSLEDSATKTAEEKKKIADDEFAKANVSGLVDAYGLVGGENNKSDAYSVFGSFDANTKASAEIGSSSAPKGEVALVIGKVFSTGVASQFLTEGMRSYYTGIGIAQAEKHKAGCLAIGENYISEYKKTLNINDDADKKKLGTFYEKILETCLKSSNEISARISDQLMNPKK